MDLVANALISLMALGARFLKVTPCSCFPRNVSIPRLQSIKTRPDESLKRRVSARGVGKRTLLCMWMVYSRAITSWMAARGFFWFLVVVDISAQGPNFVRDLKMTGPG